MKKIRNFLTTSVAVSVMFLGTSAIADEMNCEAPYRDHIVQYADEHNPENRLLTLNYKDMEFLNAVDIEGLSTHHADPVGTLEGANYMMLVSKGSYFVTILDIKSDKFIKKIHLPFRPRSADAYNKERDLILLNSRDRPAAVLIDAKKLKIVGRAGFHTRCNLRRAAPIEKIKDMFASQENFDPKFKCFAPDFGGDQISGHPLWLSKDEFVIIDRANRAIEVYTIEKKGDYYKTKLLQVLKTNTSMHQMIPLDKNNPNNKIFFGMTEGNRALNIVPRVYKFKFDGKRLKIVKITNFYQGKLEGMFGHNLYITPDKKYLYAPIADHFSGEKISNARLKRKVLQEFEKFKNLEKYGKKFRNYVSWKGISYYQKELKKLGKIFVINTKTMWVQKVIEGGYGAGHVAFSRQRGLAIVTNHLDNYVTIIDYKHHKFLKNIALNFPREGIFNLTQSHMQHVSEDGKYYYNFWSDGGRFFRINLDTLTLDGSVYVGGIPIQGNFYKKVHVDCNPTPIVYEDGFEEVFEQDRPLTNIDKIFEKFDLVSYYKKYLQKKDNKDNERDDDIDDKKDNDRNGIDNDRDSVNRGDVDNNRDGRGKERVNRNENTRSIYDILKKWKNFNRERDNNRNDLDRDRGNRDENRRNIYGTKRWNNSFKRDNKKNDLDRDRDTRNQSTRSIYDILRRWNLFNGKKAD